MSITYGIAYENLLNAVNAKFNRPLKDGFRMEGHEVPGVIRRLAERKRRITVR